MSAPEHTPGPWRVYPAGTSVPHYDVCPRVVSNHPSGRSADAPPSDADARLIAAAPEMYEALKEIIDQWDASKALLDASSKGISGMPIVNQKLWSAIGHARAALAKTEGKP